jgi:hypothetical protein
VSSGLELTLTQRKIFLSVPSTDNFPAWKLALTRSCQEYAEISYFGFDLKNNIMAVCRLSFKTLNLLSAKRAMGTHSVCRVESERLNCHNPCAYSQDLRWRAFPLHFSRLEFKVSRYFVAHNIILLLTFPISTLFKFRLPTFLDTH